MGLLSKEQLRAFIKENKLVTAQDAQNALKDLFYPVYNFNFTGFSI
jgi:putative transposase